MNHTSTTSKKTLFILSSVESTMGASTDMMNGSSNKMSAGSHDFTPSKPSRSSSGSGGGFGSLLRRVGGSQRGMDSSSNHNKEDQQQPQQQAMSSESERGLGGLFRRARGSLQRSQSDSVATRGSLDRCQSDSAATTSVRRNRRLDQHDSSEEDDEGPSGVTSFLQQIEDKPRQALSQSEHGATTRGAPPEQPQQQQQQKKQGMIRGLINRAASFRSYRSRAEREQEQQQHLPDLEPVLVLTDGNHGKVVFQNLDIVDPAYSSSNLGADMDSSMPDLCATSSRSDSTSNNKMSSSFHTARTSVTTRDSTVDDQYFLDFSEREELAPSSSSASGGAAAAAPEVNATAAAAAEDKETKKKKEGGIIRGLFRRTKSGNLVAASSGSGAEGDNGSPELTTTTDDSSGDGSTDDSQGSSSSSSAPPAPATASAVNKQALAPTSLKEITLPHLEEDDEDDTNNKEDPESILDVFDEDEIEGDFEKATCCSTASCDSEEGQDENYGEGEEEFTNEDQPPPPREYDELELFYEEQTFAHVGGSLLLGSQSELMTVPEYDEDDYDSEEEGEHEEEEEEEEDDDTEEMLARKSQMSLGAWLTPIVEEEKDDLSSCFSQDTSKFSQDLSCTA